MSAYPTFTDTTTWRPRPNPTVPTMHTNPTTTLDASNYPEGKKSLSGISLRAFLLGTTLGLSLSLTLFLVITTATPLWRVPFFIAALSIFHFLEYWVTAAYNTRHASVSAFLLSSNGWAYNAAHLSAIAECLLGWGIWPTSSYSAWTAPVGGVKVQVVVGVALMVLGQVVRTVAMAQAGSNFNHTVQVERKDGHMLVSHGVYSVLRHPSYFGFFWWGLGTQLVLGNAVCLAGYAVVLWRFFHGRIIREERFLVSFFGEEYENYRKRTWVGIPGIR